MSDDKFGGAIAADQAIPERPYLREEVYLRLKRYVSEIAANNSTEVPLREAELTRVLGVSRTPIREALNRLQQEGLVSVLPRRGARIMPSSLEEYLSWLEVRETVDGIAARTAAHKASSTGISELRALFAPFSEGELKKTVHSPAFAEANAKFHAAICALSGNTVLVRIYGTYHYVDTARRQLGTQPGRLVKSLREHLAIIDAIAAKDANRAEHLARTHVRSVLDTIRDTISKSAAR